MPEVEEAKTEEIAVGRVTNLHPVRDERAHAPTEGARSERGRVETLALHDVGTGADGPQEHPSVTAEDLAEAGERIAFERGRLVGAQLGRLARPAIAPKRGGAIGPPHTLDAAWSGSQ